MHYALRPLSNFLLVHNKKQTKTLLLLHNCFDRCTIQTSRRNKEPAPQRKSVADMGKPDYIEKAPGAQKSEDRPMGIFKKGLFR